jgi:pyruvate dehydrogenase E2 component (dihydrolipoamide acetyltransferase)
VSTTEVILPKLGLTMDEGVVTAWLKREGDPVDAGEALFEVETDKATMDVESPTAGYVRKLLVPAGSTVPITGVVALITTTPDEPLEERSAPELAGPTESAGIQPSPGVVSSGDEATDGRVVASPAARKRARELGVDLSALRPAKGHRISVEDVEAAQAGSAVARSLVPLSRMRRTIADRMTHAFRDVPQFSLSVDVDMTAAQQARASLDVSYADVLIAVCARTLRDHPRLAMQFTSEGLVPAAGIHIGIAVALDDGLLVPVLRDADTKDLQTISSDRAALQDSARNGRLSVDTLSGSVFSISNLGHQRVDRFTAIVNPPEAAIMAVGRVRDRVIVRDGTAAIAPTVSLTLSVDHRVVDGAQAAEFLTDLVGRLEAGSW